VLTYPNHAYPQDAEIPLDKIKAVFQTFQALLLAVTTRDEQGVADIPASYRQCVIESDLLEITKYPYSRSITAWIILSNYSLAMKSTP
jgi:hypothetical protein